MPRLRRSSYVWPMHTRGSRPWLSNATAPPLVERQSPAVSGANQPQREPTRQPAYNNATSQEQRQCHGSAVRRMFGKCIPGAHAPGYPTQRPPLVERQSPAVSGANQPQREPTHQPAQRRSTAPMPRLRRSSYVWPMHTRGSRPWLSNATAPSLTSSAVKTVPPFDQLSASEKVSSPWAVPAAQRQRTAVLLTAPTARRIGLCD